MRTGLIMLAAGSGRRFGENKLLYPLEGKPMYLHLLERLAAVCAKDGRRNLFVVSRYEEILRKTEELGGQPVFGARSGEGIAYSIRAGVERAKEMDAWAFFAADQPWLRQETIERFLRKMEEGSCALGCVRHGGQSGNPTWFTRAYREELMALEGDRGGKRIILAHEEACVYADVADGRELADVDYRCGT